MIVKFGTYIPNLMIFNLFKVAQDLFMVKVVLNHQ